MALNSYIRWCVSSCVLIKQTHNVVKCHLKSCVCWSTVGSIPADLLTHRQITVYTHTHIFLLYNPLGILTVPHSIFFVLISLGTAETVPLMMPEFSESSCWTLQFVGSFAPADLLLHRSLSAALCSAGSAADPSGLQGSQSEAGGLQLRRKDEALVSLQQVQIRPGKACFQVRASVDSDTNVCEKLLVSL